jgi:glycosyltransferase involved in cell wall biosynthesis
MDQGSPGLVSVILPTYNRATFLPDAFASIASQQHRNWELIVVDDGSTDDTPAVLDRLVAECPRPVHVVRQPNLGAYAARNTGLDHAKGEAVAFFDSDDLWLPHHLERCVEALARHPEVDWVYGACRMLEMDSGRELEPSTFYVNGRPRPFLSLRARGDGALRVIDDERAVEVQIRHGLYCGLQNSVIRQSVFEHRRLWADYLVVEDELFVIRLLAAGGRFAYFDAPHVVYRVHRDNSSGSAAGEDRARNLRIFSEMVRGLERVGKETPLSSSAHRALARRLAHERFWGLGYSAYWQGGDASHARACYRRALREWPWSARMWKTFLGSFVKGAPKPPATEDSAR